MAKGNGVDASGLKKSSHSSVEILSDLLAAMEGDRQALIDLIDSFLASYQAHLQHISAAVRSTNAQYLERSAHHFKGSLGIFCRTEALALTQSLMEMGEHNTLAQAPQTLELLEQEMATLAATLRAFIGR
jgi:HPt (histidine-containing phosphotransfer) domain-containing protein